MTRRIFDEDSYCFEFTAQVLASEAREDGTYRTVLDKTAFFPEGGGQKGDTGFLSGVRVLDTVIRDGVIGHVTEGKLSGLVEGTVDRAVRLERMRNHTGEHIVSGLAAKKYGCRNVGFHLGDGVVTMDYDVFLTPEQLADLEQAANDAVRDDLPVHAWYPENAQDYDYRSKLDLKENIRLVEIPGIDLCACCAPHVKSTAQVGLIKLLSAREYKGGVRVSMAAGGYALAHFVKMAEDEKQVSALVSLPVGETAAGVQKLKESLEEKSLALREARRALLAAQTPESPMLAVDEPELLKDAVNRLRRLFPQKTVGAWCRKNGQLMVWYALENVPALLKEKLSARGGGRDGVFSGKTEAPEETIREFFAAEIK